MKSYKCRTMRIFSIEQDFGFYRTWTMSCNFPCAPFKTTNIYTADDTRESLVQTPKCSQRQSYRAAKCLCVRKSIAGNLRERHFAINELEEHDSEAVNIGLLGYLPTRQSSDVIFRTPPFTGTSSSPSAQASADAGSTLRLSHGLTQLHMASHGSRIWSLC